MAEKLIRKMVLIPTIIFIVGFGSYALAHMGEGSGYKRGGHHGSGWHHQGYGGSWGNLSEEKIKQMQAERNAFFEATGEIRAQIYQKRLELGSELAKKDYDIEKAIALQKEISGLRSQLDLKRLDHILNLKKINPDVGRGLMGGGHWDYRMMGPGHHMGSGMGHGMMGPGYHMGPGGYGKGDARQYHMMQSSPKE